MHPAIKMLIGFIFLIVPLALYAYEFMYGQNFSILGVNLYLLKSLWTVIQGIIPPIIIVMGIFIIWLELDEWRIEKELKMEEKKVTRKAKKK